MVIIAVEFPEPGIELDVTLTSPEEELEYAMGAVLSLPED